MGERLIIDNINYSYHNLEGETLAIEDISFTVNDSEFLAIVGPSGCGKSTLLSLIAWINCARFRQYIYRNKKIFCK